MGKIVQVKSTVGYGGVRLPPANAVYLKGERATLTDKEYNGLSATIRNALTILKAGIPDPFRGTTTTQPTTAADALRLSKEYTDSAVRAVATAPGSLPAEMATHTEVATALNTARSYADGKVGTEATQRVQADDQTLQAAKAYTNTALGQVAGNFDAYGAAEQARQAAINTSGGYTDQAVSFEASARSQGDVDAVSTANGYTDGKIQTEQGSRATAITTAIQGLNLGSASTRAASDFVSPGALNTAINGRAPAFPVSSYVYNVDGTVATVTEDGITTAYTYNPDGTVATETRLGVTRTFTYNADGTIAGVS